VLYLLFGLWMLLDGALGWRVPAIAATVSVAALAVTAGTVGFLRGRRAAAAPERPRESSPERT